MLGVGAFFAAARRKSRRGSTIQALCVPTLGAVACVIPTLMFGGIGNRYMADFLPLLLIGAALGLQLLLARLTAPTMQSWARVCALALIPLTLFMFWTNVSLALNYQRIEVANVDPALTAGFLEFQSKLDNRLGLPPTPFHQGEQLPRSGSPGELFIVGDCEAVYRATDLPTSKLAAARWSPVERTNAAGHFRVRLSFRRRAPGTRVPIFVSGTRDASSVLSVKYLADGELNLVYSGPDGRAEGQPVPVEFDRDYTLDVSADRPINLLAVRLDDQVTLDSFYFYPGQDFRFGLNDVTPTLARTFPGRIESLPLGAPFCRELRARA